MRRGLEPVMTGARFVRVEARRPDLRRPFPKDFVRRLEGRTVTGLGRRAKYLTADLSSGDVLLMHLGMSGSFRVGHERKTKTPGKFHHPRPAAEAHDHVVFHMSSGATVTFNDPRRFGLMLIVPRNELADHPLMREVGPEPLGQRVRRKSPRQGLRRQENEPQGSAPRPEDRRRARQHLCLRSAAPGPAVAEAPRVDHRDAKRRAQRQGGGTGRRDQGRAQ